MFQGSIVALVTPMNPDGQVDEPTLRRLVDFHIEKQTDAIVAVGTTGESATLNHDEHRQVIKIIVDQANKRVPVIAGTGSNSTIEAIELTAYAKQVQADACLLVTPYYNKPTQEGLYRHYRAIAEAVDIPQILYNVPGRTGCDMQPGTVERLAVIDNIVGIKEAVSDLTRIQALIKLASDNFIILSGDDPTALRLILEGGKGTISVTANVAPQQIHQMCQLALQGDSSGAEAISQQLASLNKALFLEPNPIPVKYALQVLGLIGEGIRLPLTPLSEQYHEEVKAALHQAGLLN